MKKHRQSLLGQIERKGVADPKCHMARLLLDKYESLLASIETCNVEDVCKRYSKYYDFFDSMDAGKVFSAQTKVRPTILEELVERCLIPKFEHHFGGALESNGLKYGACKAYCNLYFKPESLASFLEGPSINCVEKDQDFAVYAPLALGIHGQSRSLNIPFFAVECKTYVDKTMLSGIAATAQAIKSGNPYCRFVVVCEEWEVSNDTDPALSMIDEIYVLRKSRRTKGDSTRSALQPDVLKAYVQEAIEHLRATWSNVNESLNISGKLIGSR